MKPMIISNRYHQQVINKLAQNPNKISVTNEQLVSRVLQMFPEYRPGPLLQLSDIVKDIELIANKNFCLPEECKVYKSEYYAKNKEKIKAINRDYRKKHKEALYAKSKEKYRLRKEKENKVKGEKYEGTY